MSGNQKDFDNHANQLNPNNPVYYVSRGMPDRPSDWSNYGSSGNPPTQSDFNNHANQRNPNNWEYQHSRDVAGSKQK